jgi:hypothetical protein
MSKVRVWSPSTIVDSLVPSALLLKEKPFSAADWLVKLARLPEAPMTTPGEEKSMLVDLNV